MQCHTIKITEKLSIGGLQILSVPLTRLLTFLEQCSKTHCNTSRWSVYSYSEWGIGLRWTCE